MQEEEKTHEQRRPILTRTPLLGPVRLANIADVPQVLTLLCDSISKTFRVTCSNDITVLIENSVLCICQLDPRNNVIGFLAAKDYPKLPSVHPCAWEEYIWTKYKEHQLNARNTLFIHLLCWNPHYGRELVDNMLKTIFMHDAYVYHIAMIKTLISIQNLIPGHNRSEASFRRVTASERGLGPDRMPALFVADRSEVCPRLRIRRAVEEDNDDLVPILEQHSQRLRDLYGDFYISEMIGHSEPGSVLLVCEHKELAVGVMSLGTNINYEALEEAYVLLPFGGLRHVKKAPGLPKRVESLASFVKEESPVRSERRTDRTDDKGAEKDSKSRVTWVFEEEDSRNFTSVGLVSSVMEGLVISESMLDNQQVILDLFEDEDEDEFEFDIVNIDTNLLRVPEMIIYDALGGGLADNVLKIIDGTKGVPDEIQEKRPEKPKRGPHTGTTVFEMPEPVRYTGTPNAFLLQLFAIHPDYDERYGFDMLEAAFEMYPDRDYCLVSLPTDQPAFPLLEHFTLVTPFGCNMKFMNESLYVAHVNSIRGSMSVRSGEACDVNSLKEVLENAPRIDKLIDLFQSTLKSDSLQSFTLLSEHQPIGVVVLGPLDKASSIRTHYDLEPEPRKAGTDAMILAGVLSPAFEPHARWYLRELLRLSKYTTLFWICKLFAKGDACPSRNLMSLASHMNPVHPRTSLPNVSANAELEKVYYDLGSPFALWVCERPLTSLPKVNVNTSIVVVGASRTGLAFLETLLMGPASQYLTFSNLTLVSEHGVPDVADCLKAADICIPKDGRYTDRYLKSIPFYYYLDIITAVMVKIDRKKKCIYLRGGGYKYYDQLVLTCGQQFQHPDYLKESLGLVKDVAKGKPCERMLLDDPTHIWDSVPVSPEIPENVFLINSLYEANINLRKLMRMISEARDSLVVSKQNQVIVYGDHVEAYTCIAALLELGLTPEMIVFVEPFPSVEEPAPPRINCFNDELIDRRVQDSLKKLGIRVFRQCHLAAWHQIDNRVESIDFMAPMTSISLKSFALFYFGLKAINLHAFKAINECGLVYDGGLVVGPTFETNDSSVSGAGTCVRYSRRLYACRFMHRYHCSEDIGEALGRLFLNKLDPFMMADPQFQDAPDEVIPRYSSTTLGFSRSSSVTGSFSRLAGSATNTRKWQPVMRFESPLVQFAVLPGPLYYLKIRKPGKEIPMAVQQCLPRQGHNLVTDRNDNYFRVHLNVFHVVDAVVCLSHKRFAPEIYQQLYGKHEAFFNKLYSRFQKNEIEDFYKFFKQPWMSTLYQESFKDLVADINEQNIGTVKDLLKSKFAMFDADLNEVKSTLASAQSISSVSSVSGYLAEPRRQATFRTVIDKFVARAAFSNAVLTQTDIPSECGQSKQVRTQAAQFWKKSRGERIVMAHVSKYLEKNSVTNPHFAVPKPKDP
ncbi:hypothetical protein PYW07_012170 [Mythimna separata]|uniref:Cilia- and flagella-associated protein 61 N-terminal domain-containing protein n=1 Tax=Mythimna separata TaxID=271217 RepID=A0AAD7YKP1_MYTSE|nr:hypothetical protein PYW07_012170 [Mythimna separata]